MKKILLWIIRGQSLLATVGSLYYGWFGDPVVNWLSGDFFSMANGLTPCEMCRYARILMYPVFIISTVGLRRKQFDYASVLLLSLLGIILEAYQYRYQMTHTKAEVSSFLCGFDRGVSCAATEVIYWGFVTIPFLCLVAFVVIFVSTVWYRLITKTHQEQF